MTKNRPRQARSIYANLGAVFLIFLVTACYFSWPNLANLLSKLPAWGKGILWGVAILGILATTIWAWGRLRHFLALEKISEGMDPKEFFTCRLELIKTGAQIFGGIFFLVGLWFTYQNLIVAQEKQVTDLFSKAVEQLASEQIEVRLGGIYALERIAKDSAKDRLVIQEVLTAFVRERAPWPPRKKSQGAPAAPETREAKEISEITSEVKPPTDIQAVLTVLGRRQTIVQSEEHECVYLRGTDLRGAYLYGANLEGADLVGTHLDGADLVGANLRNAQLAGATFDPISKQQTNLKGADLRGATGLTWGQMKEVLVDTKTRLPENIQPEQKQFERGSIP